MRQVAKIVRKYGRMATGDSIEHTSWISCERQSFPKRPSASSLDKTASMLYRVLKEYLDNLGVKTRLTPTESATTSRSIPTILSAMDWMNISSDGVILSAAWGSYREKLCRLIKKPGSGQIPIRGMGLGASWLAYGGWTSSHGSWAFRFKYSCTKLRREKNRDESKSLYRQTW